MKQALYENQARHDPAPVPKATQVEEALSRLESQACQLRDIVSRMCTRLDPILIPTGVGANSPQGKESQAQPAPLVLKIDGLTEFLRASYSELQDLDRRLAL